MRDVRRESLQLGDNAAATFPYLNEPVEETFAQVTDILLQASTGQSAKLGVLLLGETNVGKTRLAYEALNATLPGWRFLRWNPDMTARDIHLPSDLQDTGVVMFLDNLHEYLPLTRQNSTRMQDIDDMRAVRLRAAIDKLRQETMPFVVVATCRKEEESAVLSAISWLPLLLERIPVASFSPNERDPRSQEIIQLFKQHGPIQEKEWDGTIGSLVLGLARKQSQYLALQGSLPAVALRAIKLLRLAGITLFTERRIRVVCAKVFGYDAALSDLASWRDVEDELVRLQFVSIEWSASELAFPIRKDSYFTHVITDYPGINNANQVVRDFGLLETSLKELHDSRGLIDLSRMFRHFKLHEQALSPALSVLDFEPDNTEALFELAALLFELGRPDEMLSITKAMIARDPEESRSWRLHAVALDALKQSDAALAASDQAVAAAPDNAYEWDARAQFLAERNMIDQALDAAALAIELDPLEVNHRITRGVILARVGRFEESLAEHQYASTLEPHDGHIWSNIADSLLNLQRLDEAMEASKQAETLSPDEWWVWAVRERILLANKAFESASEAADKALERVMNSP